MLRCQGGIRKSPEALCFFHVIEGRARYWQGGNPTLLRSGASYVLNPRVSSLRHLIDHCLLYMCGLRLAICVTQDEDPPHPHDRLFKERKARLMDVAANRRCWLSLQARGEFRYGNSSECHRQAINWNQDLYRLDASAGARVFGNFCGHTCTVSTADRFEVLSYGGEGCRALYRATLGTQSSDTMAYYGVVLMHENLN